MVLSEAMRTADEKPPEVPDVEVDAEDSCETQVKRAKTIMGLEVCVLEAQDDVYDDVPGAPTNLVETSGKSTTDEDVLSREVTEEVHRLKTLVRPYSAPTVDELMSRGHVHSQKTNERLDDRMVAEGRERELSTLCSQNSFVPDTRSALRPGTKTVRGRFVDDMKSDRVKKQVRGSRGAERRETRRARWHVRLEGLQDEHQSCGNARRKAPFAQRSVL